MSNDFKDFLTETHSTSKKLDQEIISMVQTDLNPSHHVVFFKLATVQGFIGFLTMLFCPQFDMSLTNSYALFHYFHSNFGHAICMVFCGSIFLGSGAVFASYILSAGEINQIKKSRFLYYTGISIMAVSGFMLAGANIYLNLLAYWLVGAIGAGMLLFELNITLRRKFA